LKRAERGDCIASRARIDGQVVVITGGNSGIGKETAIELANRGAKIYLACRNQMKCKEAVVEIQQLSRNRFVDYIQIDLASFESIHNFSRNFHQRESQLHILINNAGVLNEEKSVTKHGFEAHLGINHLGHFLLTHLLLDLLIASAPSKIIDVSSSLHRIGKINKHDLNSEKFYHWVEAYSNSKLMTLMSTEEFARRLHGSGVTANSVHPGLITSDIFRSFKPSSR
jgi:NAD(P)-dependent dehydrogenase (short-subunit alcohol dehydrogenase family)